MTVSISAPAHPRRVRRAVLTVVAGIFYALGWIAGTIAMAVVWCAIAVRIGWQEAHHGPTR